MGKYSHDFDDWEQFVGTHNLVAYRAVAWDGENIIRSGYPVANKAKAETDAECFRKEGYKDVDILGIWMTLSSTELICTELPE